MRVLVTRPEPQASATAALLHERGHRVHRFPLTSIDRLAPPLPPAETVDAVLLTSANAAFALAHYAGLPVYAVGGATGRAARLAGADRVIVAEGDWRSLARLLGGANGPPPGARLVHLAGAEVRGELAGAARRAGFGFERRVVYAARPVAWLDPPTLALLDAGGLDAGGLDAVLFFSPAHAAIWQRLVERAAIVDRLFPLAAVALSPAVAAPLAALPWRDLRVAAAPEVARLIDRLEAPG